MDVAYTSYSYNVPNIIMLTTPINATDAFTFGLPQRNVSAVCISHKALHSKGIWATHSNLNIIPVFLLQLSLSIFLTSSCKFLLKPFGEAAIVGQIMGGIIGGPTILARIHTFLVIMLPFKSLYILETVSTFGCILSLFLLATRIDVGTFRRSGKKEWAIGLSTFIFPMAIIIPASSFVGRYMDMDDRLKSMLKMVALLLVSTTFHGIACFLEDMKLLNSDLGRLAMSSAMISGFFGSTTVFMVFTAKQCKFDPGKISLLCFSTIVQLLIIGFAVRPLMIWMIKQTPPGKPMKEVYHCSVLLLVLASSLIGEVFGQHGFLGPILVGLVVPEGSGLAVSLVEKFDGFVSLVMLPLYFLACGVWTDLTNVDPAIYYAVQFLGLLSFLTKFLSATLASLCLCNLVLEEAITVGLILSTVGILDIQFYSRALQLGYIDFQCFGVMNASAMIITGCISPVVKALYDPSVRYAAYAKRTLQQTVHGGEFRIMVCVYNEDHVPNIINLLEASNPTRRNPMCVYLLHLIELVGRVTPLLVDQSLTGPHHSSLKSAESIMNAFRFFEQSNEGLVTFQAYTAIAPSLTMHNDICTLSYDKRAAVIIIPFHIQWNSTGIATESPRFRGVILKLIEKAPCSVGIFIDRGNSGWLRPVQESWSDYRVGLFFMGGSDDREALVLAAQMATHPHVRVTIIAMLAIGEKTDNVEEKRSDREAINTFRQANATREKATYREEMLADQEAACSLIRSLDSDFDLILVGRRTQSPLLVGLSEWSDFPELGLMGDLLASRDFKGNASILVVQQHQFQPPSDPACYHAQNGYDVSYQFFSASLGRRDSFTALRHLDSFTVNQDSNITLGHQDSSASSSAPFRREEHAATWW